MSNGGVICIDGAVESGWAAWTAAFWEAKLPPGVVGVVIPTKNAQWKERVSECAWKLAGIVSNLKPTQIYLEYPAYFADRGEGAAGSGALVKLAFAVGAIFQEVRRLGAVVDLVPVAEWKGQLNKEVIKHRIQKRLGTDVCERLGIKTHAWDAVGIGLYKQGRL